MKMMVKLLIILSQFYHNSICLDPTFKLFLKLSCTGTWRKKMIWSFWKSAAMALESRRLHERAFPSNVLKFWQSLLNFYKFQEHGRLQKPGTRKVTEARNTEGCRSQERGRLQKPGFSWDQLYNLIYCFRVAYSAPKHCFWSDNIFNSRLMFDRGVCLLFHRWNNFALLKALTLWLLPPI